MRDMRRNSHMAQVSNRLNIRELSIEERILLAQDIWDSIVAEEESLTLTEFERQELDSRMETYDVALERGITWEAFIERMKSEK